MAPATGRVMTLTIVMATLGLQLHLTGCVRCIHFAKSRGAPHECDPIARWWADLECAGCVRDAKNTPQDHPVLSVNTVEKRTPGTIYLGVSLGASVDHDKMVSPIGLFKSTDGAHSFSRLTQITPNDFENQNGSIAILPNGDVVLPFYEVGNTTGSPLAHSRLWVIRCEDGGQTLSRPLFVTETRVPGPPPVAVASASLLRVFLTWVTDHRVHLWYSDNGGRTWTESGWAQPKDVRASAEMSTVAISSSGTVGVAWIKRTSISSSGACRQLLFTASRDGGRTLLPSKPISDAAWCARGRWLAGGDYLGLVATQDGSFMLMWADSREGYFRLRFATVDVAEGRS